MKVYGVFHKNTLMFSDVMPYAIYEKKGHAESYMREVQKYYPAGVCSVREIELDVEGAHGGAEE